MSCSVDITGTLRSQMNQHQPLILESNQEHAAVRTDGITPTLPASMGMGGGSILLLYISSFTQTPQLKAQGINLVFFIPIARVSVFFHIRNRMLDKKIALYTALSAIPSAVLGVYLTSVVSADILRKGLALLLFVLGLSEIIKSFKNKNRAQ